jgi:thiol-disulfide isomerase/thioredoxin
VRPGHRPTARAAAALAVALAACSDPTTAAPDSAAASVPASTAKPELVAVPAGASDGVALVRDEYARAQRDGRKLIVYVGAPWCEPCVAFHRALEAGKLDAELPGVRFLDLDLETHGQLIDAAGCSSKMVPLFASATADGKCGDRRTEGGIKGDGAVRFILPRLKSIL